MRSRCMKLGRPAGVSARGQLVLLWLLVHTVAKAASAGNPVNSAAQEGRTHRIDPESVGAWESLSRCEWAPLCPSLLLVISLAGESQHQREELQASSQRLASEFHGRAAFGLLYLPEDAELATRLLGHSPGTNELPLSVVFRRGIVLLHTAETPTTSFLEQQLGLPSHEHGVPVHEEAPDAPAPAPPQEINYEYYTGARVYSREAMSRGYDEGAPDESRRRRDPKTGKRSSELEDSNRQRATYTKAQPDQPQPVSKVMRQPARGNAGGGGAATMTPGYVGARRHNNEL